VPVQGPVLEEIGEVVGKEKAKADTHQHPRREHGKNTTKSSYRAGAQAMPKQGYGGQHLKEKEHEEERVIQQAYAVPNEDGIAARVQPETGSFLQYRDKDKAGIQKRITKAKEQDEGIVTRIRLRAGIAVVSDWLPVHAELVRPVSVFPRTVHDKE